MDKYLLFLVTAVLNMFQEIHPFRVRCCTWVDFGTAPRVGVCGVDTFRHFGVMDVHWILHRGQCDAQVAFLHPRVKTVRDDL